MEKNSMRTLEERLSGPESEPWIPETAGEYIIGILEDISEREGDYGDYRVIQLFTDTGEVATVAGFGTVLAGKFAKLTDSDIGRKVSVQLVGEKQSKAGKAYKDWNVTVEKGAPVAAAQASGGEFAGDE